MELIIKHNITKNNLFKLSLYNDKFTRVTEVFGSKNMGKLHLALKNVNRGGKAFQQGFWVANPKTAGVRQQLPQPHAGTWWQDPPFTVAYRV